MYELTDIFRLETVALESNIFKIPFSYIISHQIPKYKTTNTMQETESKAITSCNNYQERTNASLIYRSEKTKNFTIVDNRLLRSPNLSLKAIGLMVKVLSLPDSWKFSTSGLSAICKEGKSAVKSTLDELKKWGYLKVTKRTPDQTQSGRIEYVYTFYEYSDKDTLQKNDTDSFNSAAQEIEPSTSNETYQNNGEQDSEKQSLDIQTTETQFQDNTSQSNTKYKKKNNEIINYELSINHSVSGNNAGGNSSDRKMDRYNSEFEKYTELVKERIDYCNFVEWLEDEEEAEEIVMMIARQICSRKPIECICGQEYPREAVKSVMLKVNISNLEDAIETVYHSDNVRNFEKYLISTLFNTVNTQHFKEDSESKYVDYAFKRDFGECTG